VIIVGLRGTQEQDAIPCVHTRELRAHAWFAGKNLGGSAISCWPNHCSTQSTMHAVLTLTCSFVTLAMLVGAALAPRR
jgi:hypothetical protein